MDVVKSVPHGFLYHAEKFLLVPITRTKLEGGAYTNSVSDQHSLYPGAHHPLEYSHGTYILEDCKYLSNIT